MVDGSGSISTIPLVLSFMFTIMIAVNTSPQAADPVRPSAASGWAGSNTSPGRGDELAPALSHVHRDEVLRAFVAAQPMLSAFLLHLCGRIEVVEETMQETAVFLCDRWSDFAGGTNFSAWIRTVARHRCLEVLRRRKTIPLWPELVDAIPDPAWDEVHEGPDERQALRACLDGLEERHRRLLELHYRDGADAATIGLILEKAEDAIYAALSRVRRRLRACIEHRLRAGTPR